MGHIRLGTLPQSKKWRSVVALLQADADVLEIALAASAAAERDLGRMPNDPVFQFVIGLLVRAPLIARSPDYASYLNELGITQEQSGSVAGLLAGLGRVLDEVSYQAGRSSDAGELAKASLLESLSIHLRDSVPSLLEPTAADVRKALASLSSGQEFSKLARDFFARLAFRSIDYFLSRELANHTGNGQRFATDTDRTIFQQDLAQHTFEAAKIVESYAGGWYGKTVWQKGELTPEAIDRFARYSFKKLRSELGRRRENA